MISFSLGSQPSRVNLSGKHFSSTLIAMKAAVDAPGEAPRSATSERSAAATTSVPNSSRPPRFTSGLDGLDALPRDSQPPVLRLRVREILIQRRQSVTLGLKHLLDQIF